MNKLIEKHQKIIDELIEKSFSSLKEKTIFLTEAKIANFQYSAVTNYFIFFSWIVVHPKSRIYSKKALIGLFAHELAHLDIIANMNFFEKISFGFRFLLTKKCKIDFERDADILAIKKRYGKELIKFEEKSSKRYIKLGGYLTVKEIKEYMKNADNIGN